MTVTLIVICEVTGAGLLSLPISMTIGFGVIGGVGAYRILTTMPAHVSPRAVFRPFQFPAFRAFGRQLLASAVENVGFVANQLLMIYFFGLIGTGAVTANNYAMRVGMLANSLITQPLAQLAQGRFCTAPVPELPRILWACIGRILGFSAIAVVGLFTFREHIVTVLYMHGRFTAGDVHSVSSMIPAWLAYFLVLSVNSVIARYMFVINKGRQYATYMLGGYLFTNVMRAFWSGPHAFAPGVIWCAVIGEGTAMILSLRTCYRATPDRISASLPLSVS
jgi:peptidoglycan biosynthesis protein MviN/MurJ (putative lipid II flippase)